MGIDFGVVSKRVILHFVEFLIFIKIENSVTSLC